MIDYVFAMVYLVMATGIDPVGLWCLARDAAMFTYWKISSAIRRLVRR